MPTHAPIDAEVLLSHSRWLARLARALVARDDELDALVQQADELAPAPPLAPDDAGEALARAELRRRVVEVVLALAEPFRSAVILRFFEEESVASIARLTKAPERTVRTRVAHGIELVREVLLATTRARTFMQLAELARARTSRESGAMRSRLAVACGVAATGVVAITAAWLFRSEPIHETARRPSSAAELEPPPVPASSAEGPVASRVAAPAEVPAPAAESAEKRNAPRTTPLATKGIVRGSLSDGLGHPVAGASVWISTATNRTDVPTLAKTELADDGDVPAEARRPRATTGPDGRYELTGVSPFRAWRVAALAEGRGVALAMREVAFQPDGAPLEIPLELVPLVVLRGTVADRSGHPIPDAHVIVVPLGENWIRTFETDASSGPSAAGAWSSPPLASRNFKVTASADGFKAPREPLDVPASLGQGEIAVDLVLEESGDLIVSGPIVDEAGKPVDLKAQFPPVFEEQDGGAHTLMSPLELIAVPGSGTKAGDALSGGVFGFFGGGNTLGTIDVDAGRYQIALPPDFRGELLAVQLFRRLESRSVRSDSFDDGVVGRAKIEDPSAPPPLVLEMARLAERSASTATLAVTVVDATSREIVDDPALEIVVEIADLPDEMQKPRPTRAAKERTRVREFPVPLGGVIVRANYQGRSATSSRLELDRPGERRELTLQLTRADAGIRGVVLAVDGTGAGGSSVLLYRLSGSESVRAPGSVMTNEGGYFDYAGLEEARYVVVVRNAVVGTVDAKSPPTLVELHCVPRWPVTLRLTDERQTVERRRARYEIVDARGIPEWSDRVNTWTDDDPLITTMLVPGSHRLVVRAAGRLVSTIPFETAIVGPKQIALDLGR